MARAIAMAFNVNANPIPRFIILTVLLDIPIKWGMSSMLSLIRVMFAASTLMSLPMSPIASPTLAFLREVVHH